MAQQNPPAHRVLPLGLRFLLALADAGHPFNSASLVPGTFPTKFNGSFRPGRGVEVRPRPLFPFWGAVGQHFLRSVQCKSREWSHQGVRARYSKQVMNVVSRRLTCTIRGSTGQGDTDSGVPVARNKSIIMSRKMRSPREVLSFCWQEEAEGTDDKQKAIGDQRTHHAKAGPAPGGHLFR